MLEKIYQDFTTQLLPKIQEGLVISRDYFTDFFGRYIKYLIITDVFWLAVCLFVLIGGVIIFYKLIKTGKKEKWEEESTGIFVTLSFFAIIIFLLFTFEKLSDLIKDLYIPEIRIIEIMKNYR